MKKIIVILVLSLIGFNVVANVNAERLTVSLIISDISVFKNGGKSQLSYLIPVVNASQLISEYENDQYKYEKTYNGKLINIKTVASGVKIDLLGSPYIVANGKNQFEYVSLKLKNRYDAIYINKGSKLDLICVGTENNVMFPTLQNCVTVDSYFQRFLETMMRNISELKEDDVPKNSYEAIYLGCWAFDMKKTNELDKYKTFVDLLKNKADFIEIMDIAKSKATEEIKQFTMPKP